MTATDELRRLLDERGIEWMDCGEGSTLIPTQDAVPRAWTVNRWPSSNDMGDCLWVQNRHPLTPEQAVEATLGRGTCMMGVERTFERIDGDEEYLLECSECGSRRWWLAHMMPRYCPDCGRKVVDA